MGGELKVDVVVVEAAEDGEVVLGLSYGGEVCGDGEPGSPPPSGIGEDTCLGEFGPVASAADIDAEFKGGYLGLVLGGYASGGGILAVLAELDDEVGEVVDYLVESVIVDEVGVVLRFVVGGLDASGDVEGGDAQFGKGLGVGGCEDGGFEIFEMKVELRGLRDGLCGVASVVDGADALHLEMAALLVPTDHVDANHEAAELDGTDFHALSGEAFEDVAVREVELVDGKVELVGECCGAAESDFLGVEVADDDRAVELGAAGQEVACEFDHGCGTGCVVVGAIVDFAVFDSEVVVVGADEDVLVAELGVAAGDDDGYVAVLLVAFEYAECHG